MKAKLTTSYIKTLDPELSDRKHYDTELKGFYLLVNKSGILTFYCRIIIAGRENTYKIGRYPSITATQARDQATVVLAKAVQGINAQEEKKKEKQRKSLEDKLTLGGFMENVYKSYLLAEKKSGAHIIANIERYFSQWNGNRLTDINEFLVANWRKQQLNRGLAAGGVNRPIASLRALLNYAFCVAKVIDHHPLGRFKQLKEDKNKIIRYLTADEEGRLRQALYGRDKRRRAERMSANNWRRQRGYEVFPEFGVEKFTDYLTPFVLLALNTGTRRGELFNLRWADVDFNSKNLGIHGKTSKSITTRTVPLNSEAIEILQKWEKQSVGKGYVFPGQSGDKITDIKKPWKKLLDDACIEKFRFHDVRHHFASRLVSVGVPLNTVRELLGHSDMQMTMRYAHLAPSQKSEAVELLIAAR
jgi:integrase